MGDSKSQKAIKLHQWFKSFGDFAEWVHCAYSWSCIGTGLPLKPAQQACLCMSKRLNSPKVHSSDELEISPRWRLKDILRKKKGHLYHVTICHKMLLCKC